jgi:hypothetical protein
MNAEVVGDGVHVQEPEHEQSDRDHADEHEQDQDEAGDSVRRKMALATG